MNMGWDMATMVRWIMAGLVAGCLLAGCPPATPDSGPVVRDLSTTSVVLGETIFFYGNNFRRGGDEGVTRLTFNGVYAGDDGSSTDAQFSFEPLFDGKAKRGSDEYEVLRWSRFGPFRIPFAADLRVPGLFRGEIIATNVLVDGTQNSTSEPATFELRVEPSVAIEELQPIIADCGSPALRGLAGMAYRMQVRAIGLTPTNFSYTINEINGQSGPTTIGHAAYGPTDVLGELEPFVLNRVPDDVASYVTDIRVVATSEDGRVVETALPFTVHRPLEFYYDGTLGVAQYYEPVPVSGCMPGTVGNRVVYSESTTEALQRSVTIAVSRNWSTEHGVSNSSNWSEGYGEEVSNSTSVGQDVSLSETSGTEETYGVSYDHASSNEVGYETSSGENWNYNMTEGTTNATEQARLEQMSTDVNLSDTLSINGSVSIPGVADVGGENSVTAGVARGTMSNETNTTRTEQRQDRGYSVGGEQSETESFGSTTTDSSGTSVGGSYALSSTNSSSRSIEDTQARSQSHTMELGGATDISTVSSEGMTESEERTWVVSSEHTTLTEYSGFIPVDRFGVFYRQTLRLVRTGYLRSYDLCGRSEVQGKMNFNEWTWAPALAIGESCTPSLPKSDLPAAQCLIPPCD